MTARCLALCKVTNFPCPNCKCQSWRHKSRALLPYIFNFCRVDAGPNGEWESAHLEKRACFLMRRAGPASCFASETQSALLGERRVWCLPIRLPLASFSSNGGVCTDKLCSVLVRERKRLGFCSHCASEVDVLCRRSGEIRRWRGSCYLGDTRTLKHTQLCPAL